MNDDQTREQPDSGPDTSASDSESEAPSEFLLSPEQQAALYDIGHSLYQQQRFEEATCIFLYLTAQNAFSARYSFALGACMQAHSAHELACQAYSFCRVLEPANPLPVFHLAECQMQMSKREEALANYRDAVALSENFPQLAEFTRRARAMAGLIEETIKG